MESLVRRTDTEWLRSACADALVPPKDVRAPNLLVLDHTLQGHFHEFVLGRVLIALDHARDLVGRSGLRKDSEYLFSVLAHRFPSAEWPIALTVSTY